MAPMKIQLLSAPPNFPSAHVSVSDQPPSLREHEDVNVPPELLPDVGTLLAAFHDYVASKGYACFREPKLDGGNHITDWWLRVTIDERAPARSVVQYGETVFDGVNPVPHLWVRSKAPFRHESYTLLKGFLQKARLRRLALYRRAAPHRRVMVLDKMLNTKKVGCVTTTQAPCFLGTGTPSQRSTSTRELLRNGPDMLREKQRGCGMSAHIYGFGTKMHL